MSFVITLLLLAAVIAVVAYVVKHPKPSTESNTNYASGVVDGLEKAVIAEAETLTTDVKDAAKAAKTTTP
jgi:hypothetical protein